MLKSQFQGSFVCERWRSHTDNHLSFHNHRFKHLQREHLMSHGMSDLNISVLSDFPQAFCLVLRQIRHKAQ